MKKYLFIFGLAGLMTGCAGQYDITTTGGQRITNVSKPVLQKEKDAYFFNDAQGHPMSITSARVSVIEPHRKVDSSKGGFNPTFSR